MQYLGRKIFSLFKHLSWKFKGTNIKPERKGCKICSSVSSLFNPFHPTGPIFRPKIIYLLITSLMHFFNLKCRFDCFYVGQGQFNVAIKLRSSKLENKPENLNKNAPKIVLQSGWSVLSLPAGRLQHGQIFPKKKCRMCCLL